VLSSACLAARALAPQPRLIVADEPLSGADVSIRGQILNLLLDIKQAHGIAYPLITHDISVARAFSNRVTVMMRGAIVETGPSELVLAKPEHAYTRRLLAASAGFRIRGSAEPAVPRTTKT